MTSQIIKIAQHNKNLATSYPKDNSCIFNNSEEIVFVEWVFVTLFYTCAYKYGSGLMENHNQAID